MDRQEFLKLINDYLEGKASPEDERKLLNFYNSFQSSEVLPEEKTALEDRMLQRLMSTVNENSEKGRYRYLGAWKNVAAAVLVLIAAGLMSLIYFKEKPAIVKLKPAKTEVRPGGNKAVLTLSDGTKVDLDSAGNGLVANQGKMTVRKTANGLIVYEGTAEKENPGHDYNTITTPRGGQFRLTLPDGTMVWLNAASSISFPVDFTAGNRRVELKGEAYFEVKSAPAPFMVKTAQQTVNVLGTHFNVRAYEDEPGNETTLLEGAVRVTANNSSKVLKPGQQARISAQIDIINGVKVDDVVAWKDGLFIFDNKDLHEAMRQIARWYDVEIIYESNTPDVEITGVLPRTSSLSKLLEVLAYAGEVKFRIDGKKIFVKSKIAI